MEAKMPPRLVSLIEEYLDAAPTYPRDAVAKLMELAYRVGENHGLKVALGREESDEPKIERSKP